MSSEIAFNLDQSKTLSGGNGLKGYHILIFINIFFFLTDMPRIKRNGELVATTGCV